MDTINNYLINNSSEDSLVFWTALMTIATFLLFIVAVFQEKIKNHFYKPKLNCRVIMKNPDCHLLKSKNVYFFRFRIENNGNVSAKNVEVILKDVKDENGNYIGLSNDNLVWSSHDRQKNLTVRMYWDFISPSTFQYCNLGSVSKPIQQQPNLKFTMSVYWPTTDGIYNLVNGSYTFSIIVGCENGKSITKNFKLDFSPEVWSDDENELFKKVIIKEN